MHRYAPSYHRAMNYLIHNGSDATARKLVAQAIRTIRHRDGKEQARRELRHFYFVCPPIK